MQLIDGKATAAAIKEQIAQEVAQIVAAGGKQPHLVAVLVGHDGGSETYVKNKVLAAARSVDSSRPSSVMRRMLPKKSSCSA